MLFRVTISEPHPTGDERLTHERGRSGVSPNWFASRTIATPSGRSLMTIAMNAGNGRKSLTYSQSREQHSPTGRRHMIVGSRSAGSDDIKADIARVVRSIKFTDLHDYRQQLGHLADAHSTAIRVASAACRIRPAICSPRSSAVRACPALRTDATAWSGTAHLHVRTRYVWGSTLIWTCFAHHLSRMAENASRVHKTEQAAGLVGIVGEDLADERQ